MSQLSRQCAISRSNFGRSQSTVESKSTSNDLHNVWRVDFEGLKPFEESYFEEFEDEKLEDYHDRLLTWMSTTPLPTYCKKGTILPTNPNNKNCKTTQTLLGYYGNIHTDIKARFPKHPDFQAGDPTWYPEKRAKFQRECDRFQLHLKNTENLVFGQTQSHPLYRDCRSDRRTQFWEEDDVEDAWHFSKTELTPHDVISQIDLISLNKNAIRYYDPFTNDKTMEQAFLMNMDYLAAARGGEPKFLKYPQVYYDPHFQVFVFLKFESKTLKAGKETPMVPDHSSPYPCFYHSYGRFICLGKGLRRTEEDVKDGSLNTVFPKLNKGKSGGAADKLTTAIQDLMPKGMDKETKKLWSSKSCRQGAITTMARHPNLGIFEVTGRSGHSVGNVVDFYNANDLKASLPGALVLAGHPNPFSNSYLPRFEILGSCMKDMYYKFVLACADPIDVEVLKPGNKLFHLVVTSVASLVMWHNQVTKDLGLGNAISVFLRTKAREVGLHDSRKPHLSPEAILEDHSTILLSDFTRRNSPYRYFEADIEKIANQLNCLSESLYFASDSYHNVKQNANTNQNQTMTLLQQMNSKIDSIRSVNDDRIAELEGQLQSTRHKLAFLRTPTKDDSSRILGEVNPSPSKRARMSVPISQSQNTTVRQITTGSDGTSTRQEASVSPQKFMEVSEPLASLVQPMSSLTQAHISAVEQARKKSNTIMAGSKMRIVAESTSNSDVTLAYLLRSMVMEGIFLSWRPGTPFKQLPHPGWVTYGTHFKQVMDLVDFTISDEDRRILTQPFASMPEKEWMKFLEKVDGLCLDQMWRFEKLDPETQRKMQRTKTGRKQSSNFIGLGDRVKKYKQEYMNGLTAGSEKPKDAVKCPLVPPEMVQGPGTPKGNHSIYKFYKKKSQQSTVPTAFPVASEVEILDTEGDDSFDSPIVVTAVTESTPPTTPKAL